MSVPLGDKMKSPVNEPNRHSPHGLGPSLLLKCFTSSFLTCHILYTSLCIFVIFLQICDVSARRSVVAPNFSLSPPKVNRARIQYKTTYACEHRELHLNCEPNESIHLVRANYGRFSLSICNEGGRLDLSVMCMSYRSFLIMTDRCSNKSNCSVVVSSKLFGDPCPGTAKYLEVQYHCVQGGAPSQSTRRPHEEYRLLGNTSSVNYSINSAVPTTTYAPSVQVGSQNHQTTSSPSQVPAISTLNSIVTELPIETNSSEKSLPTAEIKVPLIFTTSSPANTLPTEEPFPPNNFDPSNFNSLVLDENYCQSIFMRSLFWNYTKRGHISTQKCPGGATGIVRWECNFNVETGRAEWFPLQPDFSECRSLWLDNLEERLSNDEPVIRITNELAQMTLTKMLYSDDLQRISRLIQQSLEHAMISIQNLQPVEVWHRHQVLKELLMFVVETISNLLGNAQDDAWLDLSIASRKEVASSLIKSLENSALLLAENTNHDGSSAIAKPNVLVSVHVLDTRIPISLQFPTFEDTSGTNEWARMDDSIFLPAQSLVDHSQDGLAKVAFFAYYRIEDLLKPSLQTDIGKFNSILASKLHNLSQSSQLSINSRVIGAAISQNGQIQHVPLSHPVTIVLRHIQEENTSPQCVYWNMNRQNWLTDGCRVESTNSTHTICMCNHLTHFALLNEVKSSSDVPVEFRFEKTVALVGCLLALFILGFASVLIFMTPNGSTVSSSIHRNLCLTLFMSELIYLIGLFCSANASIFFFSLAFLHYSLTCSFFWIFFESFDIYMNVNSIYEHFKSSKRLYWYYVIAYICPAFICLVCFIIDSNCYRNFSTIWLNVDNYLYLTMIGPIIGLVLASLAFILFAYILTRNHVITTTTIKCFEDIRVGGSRSLICWIMFLLIFQTINWSCAFAYLSKQESIFLAILFGVFNVCASIFICVFCIVKIENVQHSRLFRHLPFSFCQEDSQLSSTKNSTTSDVYSTRPVVTQVTSTQVNGINVHTPIGHSPSTPTATSPMSMSPCLPQMHPLPISQSTHWNYPPEMPTRSTILDHQSILAHQDPSCLLYNFNSTQHTKTLPRDLNPSYGQEFFVDSNLRIAENMLSKKKGKNTQANHEFASLHRPGNLSRKPFVTVSNENKYTIQAHSGIPNFAPNLDHIYESIDTESISSTLYDHNRRLNMHNFYGANYRSKSTVNDDDLSSSSIYEDKPLLFANNSSLAYDNNKSKRIFIPHHYHSNASIYDKAPKDKAIIENHQNAPVSALWQFSKDSNELPDLLQKSNFANKLLVSYSGENRFLNKVVNSNQKSSLNK